MWAINRLLKVLTAAAWASLLLVLGAALLPPAGEWGAGYVILAFFVALPLSLVTMALTMARFLYGGRGKVSALKLSLGCGPFTVLVVLFAFFASAV